MVRVLNLFCVALMGLSILGLYHVSEKTRVAHMTAKSSRVESGGCDGASSHPPNLTSEPVLASKPKRAQSKELR